VNEARQQNLSRVVSNSRFLIVPYVKAPHLASHVLGMVLRRLRADWMERYGEDPVLVKHSLKNSGTGDMLSGSQLDRGGEKPKDGGVRTRIISVRWQSRRCCCTHWMKTLVNCYCEAVATVATGIEEPRSKPANADWAEEEFGGARLGDQRLNQRLVTIARDFGANPQAQIPGACQSRAKTKAAYRFFEHPKTAMKLLLEPHYKSTIQRMSQEKVVLSVQDTTSLNYSAHPETNGMGPIGSSKDGAVGLIMHDTMAFTGEGTPLGLIDVQCWARDSGTFGKHHERKQKPIEQKESIKWLKSLESCW